MATPRRFLLSILGIGIIAALLRCGPGVPPLRGFSDGDGNGEPLPPLSLTRISPSNGTRSTLVTLTGTGFASTLTITIGSTACTSATIVSATELTCRTGASAPGAADVTITRSDSATATLTSAFTYYVYAYVSFNGSATIKAYSLDSQAELTQIGAPVGVGSGTSRFFLDPMNARLFVSNGSDIREFRIDRDTGTLTTVPNSPFSSSTDSDSFTLNPAGSFLFTSRNSGSSPDLRAFSVDATSGDLALVGSAGGGNSTKTVAVSPDGGSLYTLETDGLPPLDGYQIGSQGELTAHASNPSGSFVATDIIVEPVGKFVFLVSTSLGKLRAYTRDSSTGLLSNPQTIDFATTTAGKLTAHPTQSFLYVTSEGDDNGSVFTWDAESGVLTNVGGSNFSTGDAPIRLRLTPTVTHALVPNSGTTTLSRFTVGSDGKLTALSNISVGDTMRDLVIF